MIQTAPATSVTCLPQAKEHLSVCQLQLTRLVRQHSAIAGWFTYPHTLLHPPQRLRSILVPLEEDQATQLTYLESEEFLRVLTLNAAEIQPDVWTLCCRTPANIYGLKFLEPISNEWVYLVLWRDRPFSLGEEEQLQQEIDVFKTAIFLDQQHQQQQSKTEQLEQVLRRIEHQLRNPLAVMHLYASNLHRSLKQETDRMQAASIRDAVRYLTDHLTELINSCQRTQSQRKSFDVKVLCADVMQGLQLLTQDKQVQIQLPAQPLHIRADQAQLRQVFENLIHNALCFSPQNGHITIGWQEFHREVLITIADQGPGLTATDLPQIFQPYYSKRVDGSGLGLAIAQQIVSSHHGKIWADNLPTGGAQFSIVLPRLSPDCYTSSGDSAATAPCDGI